VNTIAGHKAKNKHEHAVYFLGVSYRELRVQGYAMRRLWYDASPIWSGV
jgi:hypothetical protein